MTNRPGQDHARIRECLPIKRIINMARGASPADWSDPLPAPWEDRFLMLCDAIMKGQLSATQHPNGMERWQQVCLLDVWRFQAGHAGEELAWLREFCQDWSPRCGRELPEPETVEPREPALPKKRFNRRAVEDWYKEKRVSHWKDGDPIPTQDEDVEAAKAKFRDEVTRDFVRDLRHKFAPAEWKVSRQGPKSIPPSE